MRGLEVGPHLTGWLRGVKKSTVRHMGQRFRPAASNGQHEKERCAGARGASGSRGRLSGTNARKLTPLKCLHDQMKISVGRWGASQAITDDSSPRRKKKSLTIKSRTGSRCIDVRARILTVVHGSGQAVLAKRVPGAENKNQTIKSS